MHAAVFTHSVVAHRNIVAMLHTAGFVVCQFSGSTEASKRHDAIREFQESGERREGVAKVFVVTIKTGSVGITLTAASRVYLMEPCLDPGAPTPRAAWSLPGTCAQLTMHSVAMAPTSTARPSLTAT